MLGIMKQSTKVVLGTIAITIRIAMLFLNVYKNFNRKSTVLIYWKNSIQFYVLHFDVLGD